MRPAARSPSPAPRERGTQGVRATRRAHPFTPTRGKSPLPQRFCAEPMYPYQEVGRGAFRKTNAQALTNCTVKVHNSPSLRFPPLREGNQGLGSPCEQGEP